jgi:hypothetical protein
MKDLTILVMTRALSRDVRKTILHFLHHGESSGGKGKGKGKGKSGGKGNSSKPCNDFSESQKLYVTQLIQQQTEGILKHLSGTSSSSSSDSSSSSSSASSSNNSANF